MLMAAFNFSTVDYRLPTNKGGAWVSTLNRI